MKSFFFVINVFLLTVLESQERCRNQGGHDLTSCSTHYLPTTKWDFACYDKKPYVRYCHIPALNGASNKPHFKFSSYSYFTADTAYKTCKQVGGKVPDLNKAYDALWLVKSIEYLSSFVRFAWPYSLRWSSWPVGNTCPLHDSIFILVIKLQNIYTN